MTRQETPRYDVNKDGEIRPHVSPSHLRRRANTTLVNQVPKYTREYLEILSRTLNARLKTIDDDAVHYQETLARTRRIHKCVMAVLIVLGLLWFVTSIIILVVVFKGRAFH
ncbi:hypothetical protein F4825DRAFT_413766 [Nemania diffusa]|nr:hypothetical protein F4825DRAFT_413766 [Nemania diffusa]